MKSILKFTIFCSLTFFSCSSNLQNNPKDYFEGRIDYKVSFKAKLENLDTTFLRSILGNASTFYFKKGNYRQDYDIKDLQREVYLVKENKSYFKRDQSDTLHWKEMSGPENKVLKFEVNKNKASILNIDCDELIVHYENKTYKYYFNSESLSIDPKWFQNFKSFNKNFTTKKMKSLFLKCEIEYPQFIAIITAEKISKESISDEIFEIPNNAILKEEK
jgi:hypothetical protein